MTPQKPFAPAAERNKQAILTVLQNELTADDRVFEFGSGTGQHICHFAAHLPQVQWQPSELADKLHGIRQWIAESGCKNIQAPIELDLNTEEQELPAASHCYSANTLHIISWPLIERLFNYSASILNHGGKLFVYGPFAFNGEHTSEGNRQFDQQLQSLNAQSGIRDIVDLDQLAGRLGFAAARAHPMPANNHLLIWDSRSR